MRARPADSTLAAAALLCVTAVWGSTFVLLKDVLDRVPAADFLAVRFTVAALVMAALRPRAVRSLPRPALRRAGALGAVYGAAQVAQTVALAHVAASVSGFLTGMYVVLTPLFGALLLRHRVPRAVWGAVALATVGLALLSLHGLSVGGWEALTLASAALYALHILGLGAWARPQEAYGLAVVQLAAIAVVCWIGATRGGWQLPTRPADWAVLAYMALISGALAMVVQTWAQAHLSATRAAIVMTAEPVWAAGFAVAFGGETLGGRALLGGGCVLAAMYLCELSPRAAAAPVEEHPSTAVPHPP